MPYVFALCGVLSGALSGPSTPLAKMLVRVSPLAMTAQRDSAIVDPIQRRPDRTANANNPIRPPAVASFLVAVTCFITT